MDGPDLSSDSRRLRSASAAVFCLSPLKVFFWLPGVDRDSCEDCKGIASSIARSATELLAPANCLCWGLGLCLNVDESLLRKLCGAALSICLPLLL